MLGVYAVTVEEGSLLPSELWSAAARHVDAIALGCGLVPLILGGGWMLATVVRPDPRREHALATLSLVTLAVLTLQVASFVVRFGGEVVRDRYLFYVVPLLLVGTAAALHSASRRRLAIGASVATIFFAATVASLPFTTFEGVWVDSPASVLNDWLIEQSGGLGTGTFVGLLGLFTGLVLVLGLLLAPRGVFAGVVAAALVAFSLLTLWSEADRIVEGTGLSGRPLAEPPGVVLDWVDGFVPEGESAALVAYPVSTAWDTTAIRWWDLEVWNRRVARALAARDETFSYTPFPLETLDIDPEHGSRPPAEGVARLPRRRSRRLALPARRSDGREQRRPEGAHGRAAAACALDDLGPGSRRVDAAGKARAAPRFRPGSRPHDSARSRRLAGALRPHHRQTTTNRRGRGRE